MTTRFREPATRTVGRTKIVRLDLGLQTLDVCVEELDGDVRYAAPSLFPYTDFASLEEIRARLAQSFRS